MTTQELAKLKEKTKKATRLIETIDVLNKAKEKIRLEAAIKINFSTGVITTSAQDNQLTRSNFYEACRIASSELLRNIIVEFLDGLKHKAEAELAAL